MCEKVKFLGKIDSFGKDFKDDHDIIWSSSEESEPSYTQYIPQKVMKNCKSTTKRRLINKKKNKSKNYSNLHVTISENRNHLKKSKVDTLERIHRESPIFSDNLYKRFESDYDDNENQSTPLSPVFNTLFKIKTEVIDIHEVNENHNLEISDDNDKTSPILKTSFRRCEVRRQKVSRKLQLSSYTTNQTIPQEISNYLFCGKENVHLNNEKCPAKDKYHTVLNKKYNIKDNNIIDLKDVKGCILEEEIHTVKNNNNVIRNKTCFSKDINGTLCDEKYNFIDKNHIITDNKNGKPTDNVPNNFRGKKFIEDEFKISTTPISIENTQTPENNLSNSIEIESTGFVTVSENLSDPNSFTILSNISTTKDSNTNTDINESTTNGDVTDVIKRKRKYKKGGLAYRLQNLLKKEKTTVSLWKHELYLASNSNFVLPNKISYVILKVFDVSSDYGIQFLQTFDTNDNRFHVIINETSLHYVFKGKGVIKIYEPYESIVTSEKEYTVILNVSKFEYKEIIDCE